MTKIARMPHYMKTFQCTGSACDENCCMSDWIVAVDKTTFNKYGTIRDLKFRKQVEQAVSQNTDSKSAADYALIEFDSEHKCPLLNENKMCSLQIALGETYLGDVCLTYPRFLNVVDGEYEKGASLSCPEVARLALGDIDGIKFEEAEVNDSERIVISHRFYSSVNTLRQYFWDLRIFTMQILKTRDYSLSERMIILGLFYETLEAKYKNTYDFSPISLIDQYTTMVIEGAFREILDRIPTANTIQQRLLKQLADVRFNQKITDKRYLEIFTQFLKGLGYYEESSALLIENNWREAFHKYYVPFMKEHEYILENYLVSYVYKNLFPFTGEKTIFKSYVLLVTHYALIKMHLIGLAGFHKDKFNQEIAIRAIQSFCKIVEHNPLYIRSIHDLLEEDKLMNMACMCILIKD